MTPERRLPTVDQLLDIVLAVTLGVYAIGAFIGVLLFVCWLEGVV